MRAFARVVAFPNWKIIVSLAVSTLSPPDSNFSRSKKCDQVNDNGLLPRPATSESPSLLYRSVIVRLTLRYGHSVGLTSRGAGHYPLDEFSHQANVGQLSAVGRLQNHQVSQISGSPKNTGGN
jgi:hypothetical protein